MKLIRIIIALATLLLFVPGSQAEVTPSHRDAVMRLFKVLKLDEQYDNGMMAGFDASSGLTEERLKSMPEEQRTKVTRAMTKIKAKMKELMGWDKVKGDMVEIYAKHFTEKEVEAVIKLMETPTAQMMISKQIGLMAESMAIGQKRAKEMMPEIMKIMQEEMK